MALGGNEVIDFVLFFQRSVHEISPSFSSPIETPSPKIKSPKFEQKSRKPPKKKNSGPTPVAKEKKLEPAVRIEPLVVNDPFSEAEEDEEILESPKKAEKKRGSPTKKGKSLFLCCIGMLCLSRS